MPLLFKQKNPVMGVWKLEESSEELLTLLSHPAWYEPALQQFLIEKRRCEWLACRVLLKELLEEELPVSYKANGAPYIAGYPGTISFSHTKGYVAILVSNYDVAGIDIECYSHRAFKIRRRFMNDAELALTTTCTEAAYALLCWSAKETLFKMLGREGIDFRKDLHISSIQYAAPGKVKVKETFTSLQHTYWLHFLLTPGFALTWSE
ncbi:MAG: 4'-phosphopantetheinyl transferase superfamily protein [Tannerellaceae bacterium]|nr:4'-phosphopantetheinyl transferase superfamily protein [Tannerellaceae bacterium]MCD8264471.1 4'-phosphopantetheinyl transferase superfamily protein [Tannerellaceae bacterium]